MAFSVLQKTIKREISFSGIGLFSGQKSTVKLIPAEKDTGILFKINDTLMTAEVKNVKSTNRCTVLGDDKNQCQIGTVEHLLSALYALGISNLIVEVEGLEIPILDGSAGELVKLIEIAGIKEQTALREVLKIEEPVYFDNHTTQMIALPYEGLKISCLFCYPADLEKPAQQFFSLIVEKDSFIKEIAEARTFSFYEEIKPFLDQGYIKGGSLENAILIKENKVLNPEGLRFEDEFVRHKILDLIGDLSLIRRAVSGHIIALQSGHTTNVAFVQKLLQKEKEKHGTFAFNSERN